MVIAGKGDKPGVSKNGAPLGIWQIASSLYDKGYDVFEFAEKAVSNEKDPTKIGTGIAFDTVLMAEQRGVTNVVVFGHSYGGDATYDLTTKISSSLVTMTIPFTAYIGAVARPNLLGNPQRNRPPGSLYHVNFYEQRSGIFKSAATDGPASTTVNQQLDVGHFVIPYDSTVQSTIINGIFVKAGVR